MTNPDYSARAALAQMRRDLDTIRKAMENEMSDCMSAGSVPMRRDLDTIRKALEALPND
jgi:hypothetical protein